MHFLFFEGKNFVPLCQLFFYGNKFDNIYFAIPEKVRKHKGWTAIIIFGDRKEIAAIPFPNRNEMITLYDFPELSLHLAPQREQRIKYENPLIEHVVKTKIKNHPQITFFLRKPIRAKTFQEANGVLALCLLSNSVEAMRKRLQEAEIKDDFTPLLKFAEQNKLVILCWGSQRFWNPAYNWNDLNKNMSKDIDNTAEELAEAWEKGVLHLARRYNLPTTDYLISGYSGSAQYALRLVMKKPQYFLAAHLHIPSSFDYPSANANNVILCLTTGEWEVGYDRSIKFLEAAQKADYLIIYKAIPKLGHADHWQATKIGLEFFRYILCVKSQNKTSAVEEIRSTFRNSPFVADIFRQKIYQAGKVPKQPALLIPLPTQSLAEAWK